MDYTKLTLGELLTDKNKTIRRNATSILKRLQKRATIKDRKTNIIEKRKVRIWGQGKV